MKFTIDVSSFGDSINHLVEHTNMTTSEQLAVIGQDAFQRIRRRTPVDTGRAKEGWTLTITPNRALIVNEVPYILQLEYGWSQQAPTGMVRITLDEIADELVTALTNS